MKVDLAAAAQANVNASAGGVRATFTGGKIEIDQVRFLDLVARAIATVMGQNLFAGRRTDGAGQMPARNYDGAPRGSGSLISRALAAVKVGPMSWLIAAHREKVGHLARIMQGIPFRAPPIGTIAAAVHAAFNRSVTLAAANAAVRVSEKGSADRAHARATAHQAREEYRQALRGLGFTGVTPERSSLGKRVSSAGRAQIRLGRR